MSASPSEGVMPRTPEPELMDDVAQARAYSEADFSVAHDAHADLVLGRLPALAEPNSRRVVDLGCGPGDVTVRLARRMPVATFVGVDGSAAMLALAEARVRDSGLADRIRFEQHLLPTPALLALAPADVVVSNSLLHHLHQPEVLWESVLMLTAPGSVIAIGDLRRPASAAEVDAIVEREAGGEPEVLRRDFHASLHAAFTPAEVRDQIAGTPLEHLMVEEVGDRHLLAWGRR